jgi:hypothetical protein
LRFLPLTTDNRQPTTIPSIKHPKRRGEWLELQFMARAASHGLIVSKPWGDSARYDFIVEHQGRFSRVQVKSTTHWSSGAHLCNTVSRALGLRPHSYTPDQIDFLAAFVIPEDLWYIVPAPLLARFAIALNPRDPRNKHARYMEAWHLLKSPTSLRVPC